jgi:heme oxygenase
MSLKDLTHEHHRNAETRPFVKVLFSGKIDPKLYATYLKNLHPMYEILEVHAMPLGLLPAVELRRAPAILNDFLELWGKDSKEVPTMCPVVDEYVRYILSIGHDPKRLMAHVYVRHMGDLSGGQLIKKRVPGAGQFYEFGRDTDELKNMIRQHLDDSMAEEAKICFDFSTKLFEQMMEVAKEYDPGLEHSN